MSQIKLRFLVGVFILLAGFGAPVSAAGVSTFTLTVKSTYLRDAPSLAAARTYSVFQGQTYPILARTADALWLKLDYPLASRDTWVLSAQGTTQGNVTLVPVATESAEPEVTSTLPMPGTPTPTGLPARLTFTITSKSCYGRSRPAPDGELVDSLFKGQVYTLHARTADRQWIQLDVTGATTEVWVPVDYGTASGDLEGLPVAATPAPPTPTPPATPEAAPIGPAAYPVVPAVSPHVREIYQRGLAMGNNPRAFSKVGDCQNVTPFFLAPFDNPSDYRLGSNYAYLQAAITNFRGSFTRKSEAVRAGFNVASVLNPMWANPQACRAKETPLECEFRLHHPSFVIVSMETWWSGAPAADYEISLRQIVEFSIDHGVVPILGTKADNLERDGSLNAAIVRVAQAYDVPLWNFWAAVQPLPNHGLVEDGFHLTWGRAFFDDAGNMQKAWPWRNLTALQALNAAWQAVK